MVPMEAIKSTVFRYWSEHASSFNARASHIEFAQEWAAVLAQAVPMPPARDVVDLGTGTGACALILAALGHRVTAVDGADGMLVQARQNAEAMGVDVRFVQGDVDDPKLPLASWDVICARNLFWTLPDPSRTLATIRGLLRPGGVLLFSDGVWRDPADPAGASDTTYGDVNDSLPFYGGIELADAEALLNRNGFGDIRHWHHLFATHPYPKPTPRRFFVLTASPISTPGAVETTT
ncbi:class I SAM-dependent methyltransferase [Reyranella sp. CPCC 100927]|uniref:class I SAM-dependent methyltransferase n=1 Tax=Reyranella sp. CPCC 100927 TaxID=2599616 RepID=UPI0011B3B769|nr:class I SAM-dependent methyltransferase [Reyranella sp. CPCC 100927]